MTTEFSGQHKNPGASKRGRRAAHLDGVRKNRRQDAEARNVQWARLSPLAQLAALDVRLGKGVGAARQRAAIAAQLAEMRKVESA